MDGLVLLQGVLVPKGLAADEAGEARLSVHLLIMIMVMILMIMVMILILMLMMREVKQGSLCTFWCFLNVTTESVRKSQP